MHCFMRLHRWVDTEDWAHQDKIVFGKRFSESVDSWIPKEFEEQVQSHLNEERPKSSWLCQRQLRFDSKKTRRCTRRGALTKRARGSPEKEKKKPIWRVSVSKNKNFAKQKKQPRLWSAYFTTKKQFLMSIPMFLIFQAKLRTSCCRTGNL